MAQQSYKQMVVSKGKAFVLQHCWKLVEYSDKWKLMDREAPLPRKETPISLDDNENKDDNEPTPKGGRNKDRPNGSRKEKRELKKKPEAKSSRQNTNEMMNSKQALVPQRMQEKKEMSKKKK
jgi:hypothetical protein